MNDVWVMSPDKIATTLQSNDLTKPTSLQISHTNTFELPDSLNVRKLTGNAEQLDSGSRFPYEPVKASLRREGETIFSGIAEFDEFSAGWNVTLYQEKRNLYDRLERSIRTADLSRYDHPWTIESINNHAERTQGVCYPLVDNGLLSRGNLPMDSMAPAVYVHTLVGQLLREEGYSLIGDLIDDPLYKRLVIPFVEAEPTANDEQWQQDRQARVTMNRPNDTADRNALASGSFINRIQPFDIDNRPDINAEQGRLQNYNPQTFTYVCDSNQRVRVQATQLFKVRNVTGSVEFILAVEKNGQNVAQEYWSTPGGYNLLNQRPDSIELDELITCVKGDRLQIRLIARRKTSVGNFQITIYNDPDSTYASFVPDLATQVGDNWLVARNLPDITALNLLKSIAFLFGGTWSVNAFRRQIHFVSFSSIVANTERAVDWSAKVDTGSEPSWRPRLDPYAQVNYLKWKEIDETKQASVRVVDQVARPVSVSYGDGVIGVNAGNLEPENTLFEMPFAASTLSEQAISGYGNPVLIKTRSYTGTGDNRTVERQATAPRLLLVAPDLIQSVPTEIISADGLSNTPATARLKPAWFGVRPLPVEGDTRFNLAFSPVPLRRGERCLIDQYYLGIKRVLRRTRVINVSLMLTPRDVAELDFERPVLLRQLQVGSLVISQQLFYINKVSDYQYGFPTPVTLIAI